MRMKAVLFDLDGTLLPMDLKVYLKDYFVRLTAKMVANGYDEKRMVDGFYAGMHAMANCDGSCTVQQALMKYRVEAFGENLTELEALFDEYYRVEFQEVQKSCGFNPKAAETVRKIKEMGYRVILATNPMYPRNATESRIRWAGLLPEDFEHFTTYEEYCNCKPNTKYYEEVLEKMGLQAEECLMVGNDVDEDMVAENIGMKVFLLTENIINKYDKNISGYPQGDLDDLMEYIQTL